MKLQTIYLRHFRTWPLFLRVSVLGIALGLFAAFVYLGFRLGQHLAFNPKQAPRLAVMFAFLALFFFAVWIWLQVVQLAKRQDWLINAVNWNIRRLRDHGLDKEVETQQVAPEFHANADQTPRWPWGSHHTEHLGHLQAAAAKWWTLYDPSDPSTAPTNNMVSEWLQQERGVSKEKARSIASILRADGLVTGPR